MSDSNEDEEVIDGDTLSPQGSGESLQSKEIGELCRIVADTAAVTYSFHFKHAPNDNEPPRNVKMGGSSLVEFPMGMHEFAYLLPNSIFRSTGASWGKVLAKPVFTINRTLPTYVHLESEVLSVPPYNMDMTFNGDCNVRFRPFDISTVSTSGGILNERTAFAFAMDINRRFGWGATERNRRTTKFGISRYSTFPDGVQISDIPIIAETNIAPRNITLSNLKYSMLASNGFRGNVKALAAFEKEKGIFYNSNPALPREASDWDDEGVFEFISKRLGHWNEKMKDIDMKEIPNFRKVAVRDRGGSRRVTKRSEQEKQQQDQPDNEEPVEGASGKVATEHTFFRAIDQTNRKRSMLIKCYISITKHNHFDNIAEGDKLGEGVVAPFKQISDVLLNSSKGIKLPLFQRLRVLMASVEMRAFIRAALHKRNLSARGAEAFVEQCVHSKLLPLRVEGIAVLWKVRNEVQLKTYVRENVAHLFYQQVSDFDPLYNNFVNALKQYPKFSAAMNTMIKRQPEDIGWTRHSKTPEPGVSVTIKLAAWPYGSYANSITGPTPGLSSDFKGALGAAVCRLLFDPAERAHELFATN